MNTLTRNGATSPWLQRPDEQLEDWLTFLRWTFTDPRPALENPIVSQLAARHQWWQRSAAIDHRLGPAKSLAEVTQSIAADAVSILYTELGAIAAESRAAPGRQRLRDLTPLLQLVAGLGGFGALPKAEQSGDVDYSTLDADELETLARASAILAKAKRYTV